MDQARSVPAQAGEREDMGEGRVTYGLTRQMRDCLLIIQEFHDALGRSPTYVEIAHELELASKSSINRLMTSLEERGYVSRSPARGTITVLKLIPMPEEVEIAGLFDRPELFARCDEGEER
ncbi:MAG TPA: hypothetical protein VFA50_16180 [Stellaceae bacterium]|nr:hypothetical protein [Stellaceae bacterium]